MSSVHPSFVLKRTYLAMRKCIEEYMQPLGLTAAQFDIIQQLLHEDGLEHRVMQERLGMTSPTLTNIVDGLVERGFISRRISPDDARVKQLFLTPKAHELHDQLGEAGKKFVATMFDGFSAREIALFQEWLEQITTNFEKATYPE
jgi:DNA-binding MarR family transcriptional regulator